MTSSVRKYSLLGGTGLAVAGLGLALAATFSDGPSNAAPVSAAGLILATSAVPLEPARIEVALLEPETRLAPIGIRPRLKPSDVQMAALSPEIVPLEPVMRAPRLLSAADVVRYRRIFELQQAGRWDAADAVIGELENDILLGHVQFQRYMHPTAYRSKFTELAAWLDDYADLPGAYRIHRLAMKRRPAGAPAPRKSVPGYLSGAGEDEAQTDAPLPRRALKDWQRDIVDGLIGRIRTLIARGGPTAASRILARRELKDWLTEVEIDKLRADIGRSYYAHGKDEKALSFAGAAAERSGALIPEADWTAGLAAWRLGDMAAAGAHFEALAHATIDDEFLVAGGAYWAARVDTARGRRDLAMRMLGAAAEYPRTIYGLLARHALGEAPPFDWVEPTLTPAQLERLMTVGAVRRAIALSEVGRHDLAEQELRKFYPGVPPAMATPLLSLVAMLDLPALEIRIASKLSQADGRRRDSALYPVPQWAPKSGFIVDQALLLAMIRQESVFDARAKSRRGARGVMQLMPRTAGFVDGERRYRGGNANRLYDPELNLELGQRYVRHLLASEGIEGNLLTMLAAYNIGPTTLKRWLKQVDYRDDPLLFIESVPSLETRRFLRRVLTNLWIYRDRLGQQSRSLAQLEAGEWPRYVRLDEAEKVAQLDRN